MAFQGWFIILVLYVDGFHHHYASIAFQGFACNLSFLNPIYHNEVWIFYYYILTKALKMGNPLP